MADLNRQDLIRHMVAEVDGLTHSMAAASLEAFLDGITQALANGKSVTLQDFGRFGIRDRHARLGINPRTHQSMLIPAAQVPYFVPSPMLKRRVDSPLQDPSEHPVFDPATDSYAPANPST